MKYIVQTIHTDSTSNETETIVGSLGVEWENLDLAKRALRRVRDLYVLERRHTDECLALIVPSREFHEAHRQALIDLTGDEKYHNVAMMFEKDDGELHRALLPWRHHGCSLKTVEIVEVIEHDTDIRFSPEDLPYDYFDARSGQD